MLVLVRAACGCGANVLWRCVRCLLPFCASACPGALFALGSWCLLLILVSAVSVLPLAPCVQYTYDSAKHGCNEFLDPHEGQCEVSNQVEEGQYHSPRFQVYRDAAAHVRVPTCGSLAFIPRNYSWSTSD